MKKSNVRLVAHIIPLHYEITLRPDLEAHTFTGNETVTIDVQKATSSITLHSKDLDITNVSIILEKKSIHADKIIYTDKLETATFTFPAKVKGGIQLSINFRGILADNMRGFYKSKYTVEGEERFMATTQFEATDARRCIPCFDEPTHKAVFRVHLVVPNSKTAISNTLPSEIREHSAGFKIVSFAETPKMSTYLLAFIVGDFEWIERKTKSGVLVRIMTIPGKKHQAKFSLDVTVKCLEFYEKYFDIPYPLNTLDMIAIPDFSSLAMENWGAITFREVGLLVDEKHTSTATRQLVAEVIAHELAHQWFGNLVTMEWWTHLWLNEGFASYIPYLALDKLFPKWKIWQQFASDTLAAALKLDALENTHPIEIDVHDPNEIGEIFDTVSYRKGASVIRMLAEYLGKNTFQKGLQFYLKKHSYKNASTIHLWEAFEETSGKPVKKMMEIWTKKSGYPVISVNKKLKIAQQRFFSSETSRRKSKDRTTWPVPYSNIKTSSWLKMNPGETGMYRTNYDSTLLVKLQKPIESSKLSPVDRLGIIRDLFALSEAGLAPTTRALEACLWYKKETEYIVWVEIVAGLRQIGNLLAGSPSEMKFKSFALEVLSFITTHVGWKAKKNEPDNDALCRSLVLGAASYFGNQKVISKAKELFKNRNKTPIPADLRNIIYSTVIREGSEKDYKTVLDMYIKEPMHEEKNRLLGALGATRNPKLLKQTLEFTMSEKVRMQDRNGAFASVLINSYGRILGWKFLQKNWMKIGEAYGDGNHLLSRLISVLNRNTTRESYDDIKKFFKTHSAPAAERTILQTLEQIDSNIVWLKRDSKNIEKWLKMRYS